MRRIKIVFLNKSKQIGDFLINFNLNDNLIYKKMN